MSYKVEIGTAQKSGPGCLRESFFVCHPCAYNRKCGNSGLIFRQEEVRLALFRPLGQFVVSGDQFIAYALN
jgi:hypothetical protein